MLAPQTHIGQTISTQPTLMWFTSERDAYRVEFTLAQYLELDTSETDRELDVIYKTNFLLTEYTQPSGITSFSLAETEVQLQPNTRYLWQVVIVCNPNRLSESLVAESIVDVVDPPDTLVDDLIAANDGIKQVSFYAQEGLWYDALAATLGLANPLPTQIRLLDDLVGVEAAQEMADEVDLSQPPLSDRNETYSELLQQAIDRMSN